MPPSRRYHGPKADRRRALELLASSRDGCTEAIMLAHGFTVPQMVDLCKAGRTPTHGYEPTRPPMAAFAKGDGTRPWQSLRLNLVHRTE
jgi:hypothetical protein